MNISPSQLEENVYELVLDLMDKVGKHNDTSDEEYDPDELATGIEIEKEHTDNPLLAKEIAKDHLAEIADHYTRLVKLEKEAKMEKSSWPMVANTYMASASPVDIETHLLAQKDESAKPYLEILRKNTEGLELSVSKDIGIPTDKGDYKLTLFVKEPNLFSGSLVDPQGTLIQEFNNQTLEIIASIMGIKLGDTLLPPPVEEVPEEDYPEEDFEELEDKELDKALNSEHTSIRKEVRITDNDVIITLYKSRESESMSSIKETKEELNKALPPKEEKKPMNLKQDKEPDPQMSDDSKKLQPELEEKEDQDQIEDPSLSTEESEGSEESDDEDVLHEVSPEDEGSQTLYPEQESEDGEELQDSELGDQNLEYIKMTQHDGGKQYWYKDPTTGKIIEKENAPEGHPDFDNGGAVQELSMRIAELERVVNGLLGKTSQSTEDSEEIEDQEEDKSKELPQDKSQIQDSAENVVKDQKQPAQLPKQSVDKEMNTKEKPQTQTQEPEESKKDKENKPIKKSRFDRMWRVFNIDMPETLDSKEDLKKANEGIKKLQKCILNQGKTTFEANRISNKAVIEKYDLLSKSSKYGVLYQKWLGGQNFNTTDNNNLTALEMQELRKSDAHDRFSVRNYIAQKEELIKEQDTGINDQIKKSMNPEAPKWNVPEFRESLEKSQPLNQDRIRHQEQVWNTPTFKESGVTAKQLAVETNSQINERIVSEDLKKSKNTTFDNRYKPYNEELTKSQKSQKTESELAREAVEKRNWGKDGKNK